jgi:hypothetical protein
VRLSHGWSRATPIFDDPHLVSYAGLVPVMALAEQTGLSELISSRVRIATTTIRSAGVNPAGKLTSVIAGMAAGADVPPDHTHVGRARWPARASVRSDGTGVGLDVSEHAAAVPRREGPYQP